MKKALKILGWFGLAVLFILVIHTIVFAVKCRQENALSQKAFNPTELKGAVPATNKTAAETVNLTNLRAMAKDTTGTNKPTGKAVERINPTSTKKATPSKETATAVIIDQDKTDNSHCSGSQWWAQLKSKLWPF